MRRRERILAISGALIVAIWIADSVLVTPVLEWLARIEAETGKAEQESSESRLLINNKERIETEWKLYHASGLFNDEGTARFLLQKTISNAARSCRFTADSITGSPVAMAGRNQNYDTIRFAVSGHGSLAEVQAFLAELETSPIPLLIERYELTASDARRDHLDITITVSTRILSDSARENRSVPDGDLQWKAARSSATIDSAILAARPFLSDRSMPNRDSTDGTRSQHERRHSVADWALVGLVVGGTGDVAFVRDVSSEIAECTLAVGDQWQGSSVTSITADGISLNVDGVRRVIAVGGHMPAKVTPKDKQ